MNVKAFRDDLEQLINRHSMENGSDTPDFLLADYLMGCLDAFNSTVKKRTHWYHPKQPACECSSPTLVCNEHRPADTSEILPRCECGHHRDCHEAAATGARK